MNQAELRVLMAAVDWRDADLETEKKSSSPSVELTKKATAQTALYKLRTRINELNAYRGVDRKKGRGHH